MAHFTLPITIEANSEQEAEQKLNKLMDIAAGQKHFTIWDCLFLLGHGYLEDRKRSDEREEKFREAEIKYHTSKAKRELAAKDKAA